MSADKKIPPKLGKDVIYIDVDDEITGIIDKVEAAQSKLVALVLPKRAATLQSVVNMRLLRRSADNAGKNVVLITTEAALLPLAGAAGLHVAKNLQSKPEVPEGPNLINPPVAAAPVAEPAAEQAANKTSTDKVSDDGEENLPNKIDYNRSIGDLAEAHDIEHPETIELGDEEDEVAAAAAGTEKLPKAPKDKALKVPNFDKFRLWLALGIAGLIALIVFIYLAIAVLPKATIAITTTSTPVSANFSLNTSGSVKSYNPDTSTIPGYSQKKDQSATMQVPATGQKNNGNKANGDITLSAGSCSSTVPSAIPAGTGVSSNDLTFITQSSATFSPVVNGSQCSFESDPVPVIAQAGGSKYNLSAGSDFTVAGYPNVSGTNSSDFSGGTDDVQTVVSQSDIDNAKQKLTESNDSSKLEKDFEKSLSQQGYYVLTSTMKQGDSNVSASPAVGQPASNTTVTLKITFTVLAVKQDDLKQAITHALSAEIDKTKQKVDDSQVLNDASIDVSSQSSSTDAALSITENTSAIPLVDANSIKKMAEGKKSGVITSEISQIPGVKSVNVKTSPFWVSKVPNKPSKITVTIKHLANGG